MPGRQFNNGSYSYGFNGKENDNEVKGTGNQQDYGMRIYDPRLGRFLSVDPITSKYPELTPYQFASNTPIWGNDLDGLEIKYCTEPTNDGKTKLKIEIAVKVFDKTGKLNEGDKLMYKLELEKGVSDIYTKNFDDKNLIVETNVNVEFTDTKLTNKDFGVELVKNVIDNKGRKSGASGNTKLEGNTEVNKMQVKVLGRTMKSIIRTLAHELGHAGGLLHPKDEDPARKPAVSGDTKNLMKTQLSEQETQKSTNIVPEQFDKIKESVDKTQKAKTDSEKQN